MQHQQDVAKLTEHDANERRITELYTKAADQIGSDKAPVRLAGLYALERLGRANADQRQVIVNVVCAYLRMPFDPPGERPAVDAGAEGYARFQELVQEHQVRLTAQRILHLHRRGDDNWWSVRIDLDGATLTGAYLPRAKFASITAYRADLTGADLSGSDLTGADFSAAVLRGVDLSRSVLREATLDGADLTAANLGGADLGEALLTGAVWSEETRWPDDAVRDEVLAKSTGLDDGRFRIEVFRFSESER